MTGKDDIIYMARCLELASKAAGMTFPNPLVGAVIVHDGRIIGEGFHLKAGGPHAEVIATGSVTEKHLLPHSTLYVSLEPCSHFGKTPPCADMIIKLGIPRVIIGTKDTSRKVAGDGIKKLKESGIEVITGVLEEECRWINRRFFTFHEKERPYIILKWAQSRDRFIDTMRKEGAIPEPNWISGKPERVLVHKWRSEEEAVLVGGATVRNDYPSLNVRYWSGRDPLKIILSRSGDTGKYLETRQTKSRVIMFTSVTGKESKDITRILLRDNETAAQQVAGYLWKSGLQSVLIEGGASVLNHFIQTGLWDEARIFTGNTDFNEGTAAPMLTGKPVRSFEFASTRLETYINNHN